MFAYIWENYIVVTIYDLCIFQVIMPKCMASQGTCAEPGGWVGMGQPEQRYLPKRDSWGQATELRLMVN